MNREDAMKILNDDAPYDPELIPFLLKMLGEKEEPMKRVRGFEPVIEEMKRTEGKVTLPVRSTEKAMASDFFANADYTVEPGEIAKIWTDVKAYMKDDECLILNVRSSMGGKFMLANTQGWIEPDYYSNESNDGNLGFFLKNISSETQYIKRGDRIGQGAFFNFLAPDNASAGEKRTGGFGSTGR